MKYKITYGSTFSSLGLCLKMKIIHNSLIFAVIFFPSNVSSRYACSWSSRIKYVETGVSVENKSENPCRLTLRAKNQNLQLVALFYDMNGCTRGVEVYDGLYQRRNLVRQFCLTRKPMVFASRRNRLVIVQTKPFQEFNLNVSLLGETSISRDQKNFWYNYKGLASREPERSFDSQSGTIKSQRVPIFQNDQNPLETTPINFHGIYKIFQSVTVSILLNITEFLGNRRSPYQYKKDYLEIRTTDNNDVMNYSGGVSESSIREIKTSVLTIEYLTSNDLTYRAFTVKYQACLDERYVNISTRHGEFELPTYTRQNETGETTCALVLRMPESPTVTLRVTINNDGDFCSSPNDLKLFADGEYISYQMSQRCRSPSYSVLSTQNVTMIFVMNDDKPIKGTFAVSLPGDKDYFRPWLPPKLEESFMNRENIISLNVTQVIIIVAFLALSVFAEGIVIMSALVLLMCRSRYKNQNRTSEHHPKADRQTKDERYPCGKNDMNAQVYEENDSYDAMNLKRAHMSEKKSNTYCTSSLPRNEYDEVSLQRDSIRINTANAYDHHEVKDVYAVATTSTQRKTTGDKDRMKTMFPVYEEHELGSTYANTN